MKQSPLIGSGNDCFFKERFMAKFSIARVPYYIAVAVFMGIVAFVSYINNTLHTGIESDIYLGIMVVAGSLSLLSVNYMLFAKDGNDDEVDTEVAGLPVSKSYYYLGVLAISAWRAVVGYQLNHSGVGIQSTYGIIWILSSVAVALFTWANYKSYTKRVATSA
jgi:hypothetical protein